MLLLCLDPGAVARASGPCGARRGGRPRIFGIHGQDGRATERGRDGARRYIFRAAPLSSRHFPRPLLLRPRLGRPAGGTRLLTARGRAVPRLPERRGVDGRPRPALIPRAGAEADSVSESVDVGYGAAEAGATGAGAAG